MYHHIYTSLRMAFSGEELWNQQTNFLRTYAAIRHLYFWAGMKRGIQHCKRCQLCAKHSIAKVKFKKTHFKGARQPMQFISMDLIGEFHPPSQQGHRNALTVICMHTNYVFCIPLKTKTAEEVVQAYLHHVYSKFGSSEKNLSDNGTEFKNKLFEEVASQLEVEYKIYTPTYRPQCNGKIEGFHKYLKSCIAKHIINNMEWDEFTDLATAAYNFIPNVSSKESPFFLMFGRDPYMPLNKLLSQAMRYLGTDEGIPDLEALQNLLQMTTTQIEYTATKRNQSFKPVKPHNFKVGDLVLVRNHMSKAFQEKYQDSYRVVKLLGKNQLKVKDQNNCVRQVHIMDVKKTTMPEVLVKNISDYKQFGCAAKLRLNLNNIEDLGWEIPMQIQAQPVLPNTEVSEVSSVALVPFSQEVTPPQGESFKTIKPNTLFQSMTNHFKEGLGQWVTAASINTTFLCVNKPYKYIAKQLNSSES